jgi:UDP-N-acetylmuramate--alanine ligase
VAQSNTKNYDIAEKPLQGQAKAARKYEVVSGRTFNVKGKKIHFIGAGGVGMSGLAQIAMENNAIVTGSDQNQSPITDKLNQLNIDVKIGHGTANISSDTDIVVISAAIKEDNPELKQARQIGCQVYKYAQMLGRMMTCYEPIAIAGTHGKSTTAGWLSYCLKQAGLDPNFIVGADIKQLGGSCGLGRSGYLVAEACEYDRSFLNLKPKIAAILNIEADHLDYYKDEAEIVDAFSQFATAVQPGGVLILNGEDTNIAKIIDRLPADLDCLTFGLDQSCDFYADNIQVINGLYAFEVYHKGRLLGPTNIKLPGTHNILNALAVIAIGINAGMTAEQGLETLGQFVGIERRLSFKGVFGDVTVIDDYAHHPTEIKASLQALKQRYEPNRIFCVFQPHQYSRTRFLLDDFSESFKLADITIVPEIYFVRDSQSSKQLVNAQMLAEKIRDKNGEAVFIESFDKITGYLKNNVTAGDLVVTMGAGDIWKVADEYIQWLGKNC